MTLPIDTDALHDYDPAADWAPTDDDAPTAAEDTPEAFEPAATEWNDLENGRRFARDHHAGLRFVPGLGWHSWDGKRWLEDTMLHHMACARRTAEQTADDPLILTSKQPERIIDRIKSMAGVNSMVKAATTLPEMLMNSDDLDSQTMLLNVANGVLDLRTGQLLPHDQELKQTKLVDIAYDPAAECPRWERFMSEVMCGDAEQVAFLQRAIGYGLTGETTDHAVFVCVGAGSNGKSVFTNLLLALLGDMGTTLPADTLLATHGEKHPTGLVGLLGRRVAVVQETEDGRRWDESTVKSLSGGDQVAARRMRQDFFVFTNRAKVWMATNHRPVVKGTDNGIWRRLKVIEFNRTWTAEQQDKGLTAALMAELPGILRWAVEGCRQWQEQGLGTSAAIERATASYRSAMDTLGNFLTDCTAEQPEGWVFSKDLYAAYVSWAKSTGETHYLLSQRQLGNRLVDRGWAGGKKGGGKAAWIGRVLTTDPF